VVFDPIASRTTCFAITASRVNDVTAKRFAIERGARYVFDKGYYCFTFWASLAAAGCPIRHRAQEQHAGADHTNPPRAEDRTSHPEDEIGYLSKRLASSRKNPFDQPIRLVTVEISTGRILTWSPMTSNRGHRNRRPL